MASVAAVVGLGHRAAYCASKGAVIALTRAPAVDHVADGVRVNAVCPGTVDSPWVQRLVADAGESVLYLASDAAGFVTGTVLIIDGGPHGGVSGVLALVTTPGHAHTTG